MTDSLAQSLVDAAAEAISDAQCDHVTEQGVLACDRCIGAGAVLAVLDGLQRWAAKDIQVQLRQLADEIRESRCP